MLYSSRFTVVLDACVLYPAPLRDFLLTIAEGELYLPKWSDIIHDEWSRNLIENREDLDPKAVHATMKAMHAAFPDANVSGFEELVTGLDLPDKDDRHVLAAAIRSNADVIVTYNLKDFPSKELDKYDVEAQEPDKFVYNLIELDSKKIKEALQRQSSRLQNPELTPLEIIDKLEVNGLTNSIKLLRSLFS